jgi:hypothetical protein
LLGAFEPAEEDEDFPLPGAAFVFKPILKMRRLCVMTPTGDQRISFVGKALQVPSPKSIIHKSSRRDGAQSKMHPREYPTIIFK